MTYKPECEDKCAEAKPSMIGGPFESIQEAQEAMPSPKPDRLAVLREKYGEKLAETFPATQEHTQPWERTSQRTLDMINDIRELLDMVEAKDKRIAEIETEGFAYKLREEITHLKAEVEDREVGRAEAIKDAIRWRREKFETVDWVEQRDTEIKSLKAENEQLGVDNLALDRAYEDEKAWRLKVQEHLAEAKAELAKKDEKIERIILQHKILSPDIEKAEANDSDEEDKYHRIRAYAELRGENRALSLMLEKMTEK